MANAVPFLRHLHVEQLMELRRKLFASLQSSFSLCCARQRCLLPVPVITLDTPNQTLQPFYSALRVLAVWQTGSLAVLQSGSLAVWLSGCLCLCMSVSVCVTLKVPLCVGGTRGYTVSAEDMLTSTAPVLPALSDYTLHPRHTRPTGPCTQCPTTQSWFAFHTAVSAHVSSHLGSSRSVFAYAGFILEHRGHTWR